LGRGGNGFFVGEVFVVVVDEGFDIRLDGFGDFTIFNGLGLSDS
jgi:hypothetical protein